MIQETQVEAKSYIVITTLAGQVVLPSIKSVEEQRAQLETMLRDSSKVLERAMTDQEGRTKVTLIPVRQIMVAEVIPAEAVQQRSQLVIPRPTVAMPQ